MTLPSNSVLFIVSVAVPLLTCLVFLFSTYFDEITKVLKGNQFLQTFIFGSVSGGLIYVIKILWDQVWGRIYSKFRSDVTIQNTDPVYTAVIDFINENHLTCAQSSMQVNTKVEKKTWKEEFREEMFGTENKIPKLDIKPNDDGQIHSFVYKSVMMQFYRKSGQTLITGHSRQPLKMEYLNLSCWGTDNTKLLQLIEDAATAKVDKESKGVSIYVSSNGWLPGFELACIRKPRDCESVILDAEYAETMLADARKFLSRSAWYHEMGIPYRRGYLLHGPPGCGKTSFALVLASELKLSICILNLSDQNMNDNSIAETLRSAPSNAIILLEDVDSVFLQRSKNESGSCSLSFSGLLNAIDGVAAQEGRIFMMTTNHLERLDPALIRPGRCDIKFEVKKASNHQLEKMFLRFFPGDTKNAALFKRRLPPDEFSMAEIQGHMLQFGHSAEACIGNCSELLSRKQKPVDEEESIFDHLRRAGLESYAAAFEYLGIYNKTGLYTTDIDLILNVCPELQLDLNAKARLEMLKTENVKLPTSLFSTVEVSSLREEFIAAYSFNGSTECSFVAADKMNAVSDSLCPVIDGAAPLVRVESKTSVTDMDECDNRDMDEAKVNAFLQEFSSDRSCYRETQRTDNIISASFLDKLSRTFVKNLSNDDGKAILSRYQLKQLLRAYPNRPIQCVLASKSISTKRSTGSYKLQQMSMLDVLKRADCVSDFYKFKGIAKNLGEMLEQHKIDKSVLTKARINECIISLLDRSAKIPSMSLIGYQILDREQLLWEFKSFFPESSQSIEKLGIEEQAFAFASKLSDAVGQGLVSKTQVKRYLNELSDKSMEAAVKNVDTLKQPTAIPEPPIEPEPELEIEYVYKWLTTVFHEDGDEDKGKRLASRYGRNFKKQGLETLDDLSMGPQLDNVTLTEVLGVDKLGHRLKIMAAHEKMIKIKV